MPVAKYSPLKYSVNISKLNIPGSSPCWHHWCPGTWGSKVEGTLQITCSTFLTYSISVSARNLLCATVSVLPCEHGGGVNRTVEEVGRLDQKKPLFRWCLLTMFLDMHIKNLQVAANNISGHANKGLPKLKNPQVAASSLFSCPYFVWDSSVPTPVTYLLLFDPTQTLQTFDQSDKTNAFKTQSQRLVTWPTKRQLHREWQRQKQIQI